MCVCLYILEREGSMCVCLYDVYTLVYTTLQMLWTTDIKEFIRLSNSPVIILCLKVFNGQVLSLPACGGPGGSGWCLTPHQPCFSKSLNACWWNFQGLALLLCTLDGGVAHTHLLPETSLTTPPPPFRLLILFNLNAWQTLCQLQTYRSRDNLQRTCRSLLQLCFLYAIELYCIHNTHTHTDHK